MTRLFTLAQVRLTEYAVVLSVVVGLGIGIALIISTALGTKITSIFTGW